MGVYHRYVYVVSVVIIDGTAKSQVLTFYTSASKLMNS